jgi:3-carboxy-cis,cis-muconate cycloisomerase
MTFSALDSDLTGPLFATSKMRSVFSDRARIEAMLHVEAALAGAQARAGLVPKGLAVAIGKVTADDLDLATLGIQAGDAGILTVPFVKAVEARLPADLRGYFHYGATSQDILDTATVLQIRDGLDLVAFEIAAIITGLRRLATAHRTTPMVGRSYGQHAAPITFGYAVAVWLSGIAEAAAELPLVYERTLTVSLGGPVGTLATLGKEGPKVLAGFADALGLGVPLIAWHVRRGRFAATGAWLAILIGALAKMATDVVHLASTEIGEVAEPHVSGRGGSSAMPHKRNPISATVILSAHSAAKSHVITLLDSMAAADQRPAGAWHAEWHALPQLFGLASGALREARRIAEGLTVNKARMRANLELTRGLLFTDAVASALAPKFGRDAAHAIIEKAADTVRDTNLSLREVLARDKNLPKSVLDAAFSLKPAINAAAAMTDRVLEDGTAPHPRVAKGKGR